MNTQTKCQNFAKSGHTGERERERERERVKRQIIGRKDTRKVLNEREREGEIEAKLKQRNETERLCKCLYWSGYYGAWNQHC